MMDEPPPIAISDSGAKSTQKLTSKLSFFTPDSRKTNADPQRGERADQNDGRQMKADRADQGGCKQGAGKDVDAGMAGGAIADRNRQAGGSRRKPGEQRPDGRDRAHLEQPSADQHNDDRRRD